MVNLSANTPSASIPNDIKEIIDRIPSPSEFNSQSSSWIGLPKANDSKTKYDRLLQEAFPDFQIVNITEFDYGRSFRYAIALSNDPNAAELDREKLAFIVERERNLDQLLVAISAISDYIDVEFIRYSWQNGEAMEERSLLPLNRLQNQTWEKLSGLLAARGFSRLEPKIAQTLVMDAGTELCDPGEATVADFLFYG